MKAKGTSICFVMGDTETDITLFDKRIVVCPVRRLFLQQKGITCDLFGDFSPEQLRGMSLDAELHNKLDESLSFEAHKNHKLRWVPLAFQQVKWPLARYIWVRECLREVINKYSPSKITMTSCKDNDFSMGLKSILNDNSIILEILDGSLDPPSSILHLLAPNDLPNRADPHWFLVLQWSLLAFMYKKTRVIYQDYHNLRKSLDKGIYMGVYLNRAVNMLGTIIGKLPFAGFLNNMKSKPAVIHDYEVTGRILLSADVWKNFKDDEKKVIQAHLDVFLEKYPPVHIDKVVNAIKVMLEKIKPTRVMIMSDNTSASRLFSYSAHKYGIPVDYLPHGIVWEDASGAYISSEYYPDRILAWNNGSRANYEKFNRKCEQIKHPRNRIKISELRPLDGKWHDKKALIMGSDWYLVTIAGREDCFVVNLMDVLRALVRLGMQPSNIHVRYHRTQSEFSRAKKANLKKVKIALGYDFVEEDNSLDSLDILSGFDLLVCGETTGIYEAVLLGIPVFVMGLNKGAKPRAGGIVNSGLPYVTSEEELYTACNNYDAAEMQLVYEKLTTDLNSGLELNELIAEDGVRQKYL